MAIQSYSKHFVPPAPLNPNYKSSLTLVLVDSLGKLTDSFQYGKVVAWDTETTGLNPEQSEIVGFSYSFDGKTAYYCPVKHIDIHLGKDALDAFYEMLTKSKMQLLYNARFDIRMMEYSGYDMSFLYAKDDKGKSTYKFIDVMNAVWLADTNITMPTLKASTLHFLGYQPPKFLETLGSEANFQYVPSSDAYEYACLDAANTYNLFKAVYPYFKEAGLSAQLDNACTYIIGQLEKQTLKLDLNYFVNLRDEISENISELKKKIYAIAGHEFNISSGRELTHVFLEQGIDTGERTKAGDMKTSIKMLSLYKKYHPECELMDLLVEYKEKIKCYNSYLKTLVEIASKQNEVPPRFSYKLQSVPCLTDRNVVMLKDIGLVSVSQVQADDYIWTQYGYKKVLWCHEHKVDEVYQVIFDNGSIIEGTDKHPVLVNKGNDTNIDVEWATLESLKDGEEVIFNHRTPLIKFSDTKDDTSAVFALYMGVLASYYLNDNVKDLQTYKDTVQALTEHQNKEDRKILFHVITHAEEIMKEVVGLSPTEMSCFLQGIYALLFQLDESRYWNRSLEDDTFSIVINRNPITPLILNILKFLGIASRLDKSENSDTWKITIYSKQGCTLFKYLIVDGIDLFALQDLFEHYNPSGIYKEYASSKVLKKTIKKGVVSVYDIEVEGVHEYIANGIVTHNTGRLSCLSGDSKIHTIMGDIPIRELNQYEQGNEVYIDPNTTASFKTLYMGKKPCFKVEMETGEILYATHDHQFLDSSTEWKRVDALKVGDKLLHSTRVLSSSNVKSITEDKEQDVYTLSVNHPRHQYVSDNLISHNCGKDGKNSYFSPINLQCLKEDTRIIKPNGMDYIRNIKTGDVIWDGEQFTYCEQLGSKKKELIKVSCGNNHYLEASKEHQVYAYHKNVVGWYSLGDLVIGDYLAVNRKYKEEKDVTIYAHLGQIDRPKGGIKRKEIHIEKPLLDFWFFCGYFIGDGCFIKDKDGFRGISLVIPNNKEDARSRLMSGLYEVGIIPYKGINRKINYSDVGTLVSKSISLSDFLLFLGFKHGAENKVIPNVIFTLSPKQKMAFIDGLISSDGRVGASIEYRTVSKDLAESLRNLLESLGYFSTYSGSRENGYSVIIHDKFRFKDEIGITVKYKHNNIIGTQRKTGLPCNLYKYYKCKKKYTHTIKENNLNHLDSLGIPEAKFAFKKIDNIESIGEHTVYDLYVPSTNRFVANGFIVHNSIPKPKSTKCFGRLATQEEIDNKQDLMGWIFSDEHPEWSVGKVVEGMSPKGNVRMGFIPENGKDDYLVSIDMSSEELRVVTNLYQEHSWADVIKSGGDLHHRNSDAIFGAESYTKETRKRAKCLSGKSLVFTDKGILPIQDLCDIREEGIPHPVNYKISTPEGISNITHFIYNGFKKTKLITFKDGTSLEVTYDHIIQSNNKLIKVEELSIGDFVDCGSNLIEVSKYQEVSLPFIKGCRLTITEDIAYLLGAILGDGSLSCKNVKYFSIDKELIEEIKRIVHSLNLSNKEPYIENMYRNKIPRNTPMTIINCGSKRLLILLECLGINKESHKNLIVPEVIFKSPSSVKGKFIRGLFDTDGWVTKSELSIGFCSKSLSFTQDIHYLLLSLGIKNTVYSSFNKVYNRDYYKIRIARSSSKQFYEVVGFCNNRKRELLENHLSKPHSKNSMPFKKEIIKIEDSETDVFDLTVDNKSHLFYANGCIVHNCAAFGMLYGQGPKGFQSNFPDMTLDEAKEFLTKFKKIIPNIISGQDRDIRIARQTGTVYTSFHRPRRVKADLQSTDKREVAFGERTVKNCYSPDTEFLTEYGWLLAKDIKPDTLIAYYEPNVGKVFYTNAGERYTNSCTESIICSSNKTSWDVTTNHRMWVRLKDEHRWEFLEARELLDNKEFYYKDNSYLSESFCDMSDYINSSFGCLPKSLVFAIIANYISELYSFNVPQYDKETLLNSCIKDIINKDDLISYLDSDNDFINSILEIIDNEEKNGFKDILKSSLSDRLVFIDSLNYYIGRDKNDRLCRVIMSEDKKYLDSIQIIMNMSGFTSHIKEITKETLSLYSLYYDFDSSSDVPLTSKDITLVKHEKPMEYSCFNVPSHILITRYKGFISYHGNTGIQGTAADVLKLEFIRLWDNIFTKYPEVKFHSTIHDEINFSVPRKLAREVIPIMIKCMTVTMPNWLVALDCSLSIGYNLGSLIPFKYNADTQEFIPDWEEDLRKEKKEDEDSINEYEDDEDNQYSIEDIEQDSIDYRMYDL